MAARPTKQNFFHRKVYIFTFLAYNRDMMENSILPQLVPIPLLRAVTHSNGQNARRITLPTRWAEHALYPQQVHIIVGDLIIVSTVEDKQKALDAAKLLEENGMMTGLPEKPLMEEVTE